jgi:phosphatidylethanolamine/phosphatidyl-N-methylethanolamine N-methyltransferase
MTPQFRTIRARRGAQFAACPPQFGDAALMVREFVRQPTAIGAITPSSLRLAEAVVAPLPRHGNPAVVELGPGTGAITRLIQSRLNGRGRHVALEINPRLAELISRRHPTVEVAQASAAQLTSVLAELAITDVDLIISGLPWAALPEALRDETLDGVSAVMAPWGVFTALGYTWVRGMPRAVRFRQALAARFEEVVTGRAVMRNLPPAFVYYARRPQ